MSSLATPSISKQIAAQLAEQIICGQLAAGDRVQELKVAHALKVSRSSVREALLLLQQHHLVDILPHCGARVTVLDEARVNGLYDLLVELYVLLGTAVANGWRTQAQLKQMQSLQEQLHHARHAGDIALFAEHSFAAIRIGYLFAKNPYVEGVLDNLLPIVQRTYHYANELRAEQLDELFAGLMDLYKAVVARDLEWVRVILQAYCEHNRQLVLTALQSRT